MSVQTKYQVQIPTPNGFWIGLGAPFDSMTAAEIFMAREPFGATDYRVVPVSVATADTSVSPTKN